MRTSVSLAALAALAVRVGAQAAPPPLVVTATQGVVFDDRNANGTRDAGEAGLSDVVVSNQSDVVRTGSDGRYSLGATGYGAVFVSIPDGYRSVGPHWKRADSPGGADFALARRSGTGAFTFALASDTHIAPASAERTRRLRAIVDSAAPDFLLITGDLVRDALRVNEAEATSYYRLFAEEAGRFRTPFFTVPGNHEIFGIERHRSLVPTTHPLYGRGMYRAFRGPDFYSFNAGGVHFVGLNTIDVSDLSYYGHVDSAQVAWLKRDIAMVPAGMPVVTFNHIPFASTGEPLNGYDDESVAPTVIKVGGNSQLRHVASNLDEVIAAIGDHPYPLALGGHMHFRERITLELGSRTMRFHTSAATVGPGGAGPYRMASGVTFYRIVSGAIDDGHFVLLDPPR
jgi:3',5'-cyclic AMP phosphodiesterase CpdA